MPIASIGIRGTIVEGVIGADAIRIAGAEASVPAGFHADPETASLIFLRGPGAGAQGGEQPGAIDVTVGDATVTVTGSGDALFVPGPGQPAIGPFALSEAGSAALAGLLRNARGGGAASPETPLVSNPIVDLFFETGGQGQIGRDPTARAALDAFIAGPRARRSPIDRPFLTLPRTPASRRRPS